MKSLVIRTILMPLLALALTFSAWAQEPTQKGRSYVSSLGVPKVSVKAGHSTAVEFPFQVAAGYHINSNRPSLPELLPTLLGFSAPADLSISKLQYPAGTLMSFAFDPNTKLSVYSGKFVIKAVVIVPTKVGLGAHTIHGDLSYQACDNRACYPPKKLPVEFVVTVAKRSKTKARPNRQSPHIH